MSDDNNNNNNNEIKGFGNPWDIQDIDNDLNRQLLEDFKGERSGFVQVGPKKYFFPKKYAEEGSNFYNFKPRTDDTWVITFPRSGTTWTQEMVWLLSNNLDYETAAKVPLAERFPFLEFSACVNNDIKAEWLAEFENDNKKREELEKVSCPATEVLQNMSSPRFIKSHLPFSLLPPDLLKCGAKVVYVARNPKDVAVSYYHLNRLIKTLDFTGDFDKFWDYFERNLHLWAPYWSHINEGWQLRNHANVLFLFYEDIKMDLKGNILKVSKFFNQDYNEQDINKLCAHLHISNFRKNPSVNMESLNNIGLLNPYDHRYVRKGEAGGWKEMFSKELNERADRWIQTNLENTDLRFPISL